MRAPDLRRAGAFTGSLAGAIAAAIVPKCPLCAAAMMTAFGASSTAALEVAPFVRGAAIGIALLSAGTFVVLEWRRRRRRACSSG